MRPREDILDQCLAKTRPGPAGPLPGRSVEEHCRIAGAVCQELLKRLLSFWTAGREHIPENTDLAAWLHDIGKITPRFQHKIYKRLRGDLPDFAAVDTRNDSQYGGHAAASMAAIKNAGAPVSFARCLGMHHGGNISDLDAFSECFGGEGWEACRQRLIHKIKGGRSYPPIENGHMEKLVGGCAVVADWIASGDIFADPAQDWRPLVPLAVDQAGFIWPHIRKDSSFSDIFGFAPNSAQVEMAKTIRQPGVYILEAPMGSGKTEAALYAAYQLLAAGLASGLYFGLPTQLTSNRIHERVEDFLGRILIDPGHAALAHGNAWLKRFLDQRMGREAGPGQSWFESGRRAILAPFAVGTADQALLAVLRVAWSNLRVMGLAGKVVILDEIHSYDAYTGYLIEELASLLTAIGSTVIILSATLTGERRGKLLKAADSPAPDQTDSQLPYPLISARTRANPLQTASPQSPPEVVVELKSVAEDKAALEEILDRADRGQQCVWIENTVDSAQNIFRLLGARAAALDIESGLIHSRFTMADRTVNESRWTTILGKNPPAGERAARGRILVGTQALEQSLDIDADFMVSRFAPTDLLLQRLGRLWRHKRQRPQGARREAWLLAPTLADVLADPKNAFASSGTAWVYHPYTLGRSLEIWHNLESIRLPGQIRPLLEATHGKRAKEPSEAMARAKKDHDLLLKRQIGNARQYTSAWGSMLPDKEARTRLAEIETVNILLLSSYDTNTGMCSLMNGETINLAACREMRREKAAMLSSFIIKAPVNRAPAAPQAGSISHLAPYLYEAGAHANPNGDMIPSNLRVIIIGREGFASDIHARALPGISYNSRLGYVFDKYQGGK